MLSKKLLDELELILKEEFNLVLSKKDLEKFARNIVGYFELLAKLKHEKNDHA